MCPSGSESGHIEQGSAKNQHTRALKDSVRSPVSRAADSCIRGIWSNTRATRVKTQRSDVVRGYPSDRTHRAAHSGVIALRHRLLEHRTRFWNTPATPIQKQVSTRSFQDAYTSTEFRPTAFQSVALSL